jgi:hypothetical protein
VRDFLLGRAVPGQSCSARQDAHGGADQGACVDARAGARQDAHGGADKGAHKDTDGGARENTRDSACQDARGGPAACQDARGGRAGEVCVRWRG